MKVDLGWLGINIKVGKTSKQEGKEGKGENKVDRTEMGRVGC